MKERKKIINTSLDDSVDLLIGAIGDVRESPASVGEHLLVVRVEERGERGQKLVQHLHRWRRVLVAAQIRQRPRDVAQERVGRVLTDER